MTRRKRVGVLGLTFKEVPARLADSSPGAVVAGSAGISSQRAP